MVEFGMTRMQAVLQQEDVYCGMLVRKIAALQPTLVLCSQGIARPVLEELAMQGVVAVPFVKRGVLVRVSRATGAAVVPSVNHLDKLPRAAVIGRARRFRVEPISLLPPGTSFPEAEVQVGGGLGRVAGLHPGESASAATRAVVERARAMRAATASLMRVDANPGQQGCTVILRGGPAALKSAKAALRAILPVVYTTDVSEALEAVGAGLAGFERQAEAAAASAPPPWATSDIFSELSRPELGADVPGVGLDEPLEVLAMAETVTVSKSPYHRDNHGKSHPVLGCSPVWRICRAGAPGDTTLSEFLHSVAGSATIDVPVLDQDEDDDSGFPGPVALFGLADAGTAVVKRVNTLATTRTWWLGTGRIEARVVRLGRAVNVADHAPPTEPLPAVMRSPALPERLRTGASASSGGSVAASPRLLPDGGGYAASAGKAASGASSGAGKASVVPPSPMLRPGAQPRSGSNSPRGRGGAAPGAGASAGQHSRAELMRRPTLRILPMSEVSDTEVLCFGTCPKQNLRSPACLLSRGAGQLSLTRFVEMFLCNRSVAAYQPAVTGHLLPAASQVRRMFVLGAHAVEFRYVPVPVLEVATRRILPRAESWAAKERDSRLAALLSEASRVHSGQMERHERCCFALGVDQASIASSSRAHASRTADAGEGAPSTPAGPGVGPAGRGSPFGAQNLPGARFTTPDEIRVTAIELAVEVATASKAARDFAVARATAITAAAEAGAALPRLWSGCDEDASCDALAASTAAWRWATRAHAAEESLARLELVVDKVFGTGVPVVGAVVNLGPPASIKQALEHGQWRGSEELAEEEATPADLVSKSRLAAKRASEGAEAAAVQSHKESATARGSTAAKLSASASQGSGTSDKKGRSGGQPSRYELRRVSTRQTLSSLRGRLRAATSSTGGAKLSPTASGADDGAAKYPGGGHTSRSTGDGLARELSVLSSSALTDGSMQPSGSLLEEAPTAKGSGDVGAERPLGPERSGEQRGALAAASAASHTQTSDTPPPAGGCLPPLPEAAREGSEDAGAVFEPTHPLWSRGCFGRTLALTPEEILLSSVGQDVVVASEGQGRDGSVKLRVSCLWATHFHALRQLCLGSQRSFVESLAISSAWRTSGGKSGSTFERSQDHRFVVKAVSRNEFTGFTRNALAYFDHMREALCGSIVDPDMRHLDGSAAAPRLVRSRRPSFLVRILGAFEVNVSFTPPTPQGAAARFSRARGPTTKSFTRNVLVMENLWYGTTVPRGLKFDLKGKARNIQASDEAREAINRARHAESERAHAAAQAEHGPQAAGLAADRSPGVGPTAGPDAAGTGAGASPDKAEKSTVLLDSDFLMLTEGQPLALTETSMAVLMDGLRGDTEFLCDCRAMDYSLLVGVNSSAGRIVVGIIDYANTFTTTKFIEHAFKSIIESDATVQAPARYRSRMLRAVRAYFMPVPTRLAGPAIALGLRSPTPVDSLGSLWEAEHAAIDSDADAHGWRLASAPARSLAEPVLGVSQS
ncbi:hypothetical protein FNF28_00953 [Cafeteria roenbergensis]|uniref:1-phosphatidylinositol-3-phosphate 5-kinase n=1 Tax=Cafeteria roenbergensis TaxID=33653 RepID=A0A5A8E2X2_CAFRO|nr:hypothetical protein FNF28_00953 [Cafeteria roenbergensis]